ncbi:hypothetical protein ACFOZ7_03850 [Natribaculum luteum]|uniref:Uncharacterized protein n=1 Tax=Natribaculum luteum TaxID=1586232 RepID=A0ABD5NVL7_9EURY|nr:hypothetical protein [Natribaculum luteum]
MTDLLDEAEAGVDSLPLHGDASEDDLVGALADEDGHRLLEAADDAADLLETADSRALLEALDLAELPDGSRPETIPEAIAGGEQSGVEDLRVLVKLARLSDGIDRDCGESLAELRTVVADRTDEHGREEGLQSTMRSALGDFGDEVQDLRGRLEGMAGDDGDADTAADDASNDERDYADVGSRQNSTMYSTMALPPSERPDMGQSTRHSTMPK